MVSLKTLSNEGSFLNKNYLPKRKIYRRSVRRTLKFYLTNRRFNSKLNFENYVLKLHKFILINN